MIVKEVGTPRTYTLDGLGRVLEVAQEGVVEQGLVKQVLSSFDYNDRGRLETAQLPHFIDQGSISSVELTYDDFDRLESVASIPSNYSFSSSSITRAIDAATSITTLKDSRQNPTTIVSQQGQSQVTFGEGAQALSLLYTYDSTQRIQKVQDAATHESSAQYDSIGRLLKYSPIAHKEQSFSYDPEGLLKEIVDTLGNKAILHFDQSKRIERLELLNPNGSSADYLNITYDTTAGTDRIKQLIGLYDTVEFSYNGFGDLSSLTQTIHATGSQYEFELVPKVVEIES